MPKLKRGRGTSLSSQCLKRKNMNRRSAYMHRKAHQTNSEAPLSPTSSDKNGDEPSDDDEVDCATSVCAYNSVKVRT